MKRITIILFVLVCLGELFAQLLHINFLHHLCKPLIMITLGGYYLVRVDKPDQSKAVVLAVIFSFLGDTLLMYEYKSGMYFITGLIAFLLAHLSYIIAYRQHRWPESENQLIGIQRIRLAFPIVLAGTGLVVILYPVLGDLRLAVMVYALVLVVMVLCALFRFGRTTLISFWLVFIGAVLFMVSDSLLAINKFLLPLKFAGVWIMITYIFAQFLIVHGLIKHVNSGNGRYEKDSAELK